jgi:hypothetical protein
VSAGITTVILPYEFDSSGVVKVILRLVLGLLGIVVVGIPYALFISHSTAAALQLVLTGGLVTAFGRIVLKHLVGAHGTIAADAVVVRPVTLCGVRLPGATGTFPIQQFEAVVVEQSSGSIDHQGGRHERISLVGRVGTPDILVARTQRGAGLSLGRELATALGLKYQEKQTLY